MGVVVFIIKQLPSPIKVSLRDSGSFIHVTFRFFFFLETFVIMQMHNALNKTYNKGFSWSSYRLSCNAYILLPLHL